MINKIVLAVCLGLFGYQAQAADKPLTERAPLRAVTKERAAAAIKEMDGYFNGPLATKIGAQTDEAVKEKKQAADQLRQQAMQAFQKNDYGSTIRFTNNAIKGILDTARLVDEKGKPDKAELDAQRQLNQLNASKPLNERAPLHAVTKERAAAAIKEMDSYYNGPLAAKLTPSSDKAVNEKKQVAEQLRQQALQAFQNNDYASTIRFANNAIKNFLDTVHLADDSGKPGKDEVDYQRQLNRVNTMLEAWAQACKDAGQHPDAVTENINALVYQGKALGEQKKFAEARDYLEKTLISIKINIRMLLQGSVLIAEKDTSPKGVYAYELFRNETYKALIELLSDPSKDFTFATFPGFVSSVAEGDKLHAEALAVLQENHYEEATQKLLESTSAYKRAVQFSGITIPD